MAKTRFFRIAVEGSTATDGRTISAEMIDQSAAAYNAVTYTARINCEHIRGFSPEAPFNAYGSVLALKAEDFKITIDGKEQTKRALYAQLDANDQLVKTVKADQKIFTSCEFTADFAKTGKFGLVGLAITDNPASLGTEALSFSALKPMWDGRKTDPANFFSAAEENRFAFETGETADQHGVLASIKGMFDAFTAKIGKGDDAVTPPALVPPVVTSTPEAANDNNFAALITGLGETMTAAMTVYATANDAKVTQLGTDLAALTAKLGTTEAPHAYTRAPAAGGGTAIATDC
jgi:hypothetical protein